MNIATMAEELEAAERAAEGLWPRPEEGWCVAKHYAMGRIYVEAVDRETHLPVSDAEAGEERMAAIRRVCECRFARTVQHAREQAKKRDRERPDWPVNTLAGMLFFMPPMDNSPTREHDVAEIAAAAKAAYQARQLEGHGHAGRLTVGVWDFLAWATLPGEAQIEKHVDTEHLQAYKALMIETGRIPSTPMKKTLSPRALARNRAILRALFPDAALTCEEIHQRILEDPAYSGRHSASTTHKALDGLERRGLVLTQHQSGEVYWLTDAGREETALQ